MPLSFNSEKCIGCKLCEQACSGSHEGDFNPLLGRLKVESYYYNEKLMFKSKLCTLCGDCVVACPFEALTMENGRLSLDEEACKNCGVCVKKCPENVIIRKEKVVGICDLCGGDPWCVRYCPHGALGYEEASACKEGI